MASSRNVVRQIKPFLSVSPEIARRRVMNFYKLCIREIPDIAYYYAFPVNIKTLKKQIREEFMKNAHVKDIRAIDLLLIKGQETLRELTDRFQPKCRAHDYIKDYRSIKSTDFLSKFLSGHDP